MPLYHPTILNKSALPVCYITSLCTRQCRRKHNMRRDMWSITDKALKPVRGNRGDPPETSARDWHVVQDTDTSGQSRLSLALLFYITGGIPKEYPTIADLGWIRLDKSLLIVVVGGTWRNDSHTTTRVAQSTQVYIRSSITPRKDKKMVGAVAVSWETDSELEFWWIHVTRLELNNLNNEQVSVLISIPEELYLWAYKSLLTALNYTSFTEWTGVRSSRRFRHWPSHLMPQIHAHQIQHNLTQQHILQYPRPPLRLPTRCDFWTSRRNTSMQHLQRAGHRIGGRVGLEGWGE